MSKAVVVIERPARWAKQLGGHLGHKIAVTEIENGWQFEIKNESGDATAIGTATATGENELTLTAESSDPELRGRMEFVLQKHLVKFAADLDPKVEWI